MPGRDGTGPMGQGTMTGRGLGYCTGVNAGLNGEAMDRRIGLGMGRRMGLGFGRGLGIGRGIGLAYGRRKGFSRFF